MHKKILLFVLVAAMLTLSACQVVEVIDHGTTPPPAETTAPPTEYEPWGFWHSYSTSGALELSKDSNKAKLYYLKTGYYAYTEIVEVDCTFDGNATFTLSLDGETLTFTFDKFANTLKTSNATYTHLEKAPTEHPVYAYPDYTKWNPSFYLTLGEIDFTAINVLFYEGAPRDIALAFYGDVKKVPLLENPTRPAKNGDVVNIDYCGKLDGVAFEGGTATGVQLFVSDYFDTGYIPGFTKGIAGHVVGDTFDVNVTFPESYHAPALAGKEVVFTMTLNGIGDLTLTDEEVNQYKDNDYTTYDQWLEAEKEAYVKSLFRDSLVKATTTVSPLPEESYLYFYQQTIDYYHMVAYYYSIDYETLALYYGLSESVVMNESIKQATYDLALYAVAAQNGLTWTDEDFSAKYDALVAEYLKSQENATEEDARKYADGMTVQIKYELTEEAVIAWAMEQAFPTVSE